jgi:hypothetical protein
MHTKVYFTLQVGTAIGRMALVYEEWNLPRQLSKWIPEDILKKMKKQYNTLFFP